MSAKELEQDYEEEESREGRIPADQRPQGQRKQVRTRKEARTDQGNQAVPLRLGQKEALLSVFQSALTRSQSIACPQEAPGILGLRLPLGCWCAAGTRPLRCCCCCSQAVRESSPEGKGN